SPAGTPAHLRDRARWPLDPMPVLRPAQLSSRRRSRALLRPLPCVPQDHDSRHRSPSTGTVANMGAQTNCYYGLTETVCDVDVMNWCNAVTTPPDMSLSVVRDQVAPVPAPPFWEAYGLLVSINGGPWFSPVASAGIYATKNFNQGAGLAFCTKTR